MFSTPLQSIQHNLFERMKCEHSGLVGCLSQVRYALATGQAALPHVRESILEFCDLTESHFLHEEEGGYMHDVADQSPELAARAEELLREHASLRHAVRSIRQRVKEGGTANSEPKNLEREFEAFAQQLMVHEAREDDLLKDAAFLKAGVPKNAK